MQDADKERYRELQYIWHAALDARSAKQHGLAIRLLEEGIALAESPVYDDPGRLRQMRRDLAEYYAELGSYLDAKRLYERCGRLYKVGDLSLCGGNIQGAIKAYRQAVGTEAFAVWPKLLDAYFVAGDYASLLKVLATEGRCVSPLARRGNVGKRGCLLALIALHETIGIERMRHHRAQIEQEYKRSYRSIVRQFGNWRSALVHLEQFYASDNIAKLRTSICKPPARTKMPNLEYDDGDVIAVLSAAKMTQSTWQVLMEALELARSHKYEEARYAIRRACGTDTGLAAVCGRAFERDLMIIQGLFHEVLDVYENQLIDEGTHGWNIYLNLLLLADRPLDGKAFARGFAWQLDHCTSFLSDHWKEFELHCQAKLDAFEVEHGHNLLRFIANRHKAEAKGTLSLFVGYPHGSDLLRNAPAFSRIHRRMHYFYSYPDFRDLAVSLLTNAENEIRATLGVPAIGEGWVSEAEMRRLLIEAFAPAEVVAQGSPPWLGRLRFDAYVPELKLAIEYQGRQHYEPVDFFGGELALKETQRRDRLKAELAAANGVDVEYIRYDENLKKRVLQIAMAYKKMLNVLTPASTRM